MIRINVSEYSGLLQQVIKIYIYASIRKCLMDHKIGLTFSEIHFCRKSIQRQVHLPYYYYRVESNLVKYAAA